MDGRIESGHDGLNSARLQLSHARLTEFLHKDYIPVIPPHTEGCLCSIFRCGAGSGGRSGASEMRRQIPLPAVQAASSQRACRAPLGPRDGDARQPVTGLPAVDLGPQRWIGVLADEEGRLKREVHRGRCGASLKHRARDARRTADLRLSTGFRQASMSRGVEVRGSVGTLAFRAPSVLSFEARRMQFRRRPARGRKEHGRRRMSAS